MNKEKDGKIKEGDYISAMKNLMKMSKNGDKIDICAAKRLIEQCDSEECIKEFESIVKTEKNCELFFELGIDIVTGKH